MSEQLVEVLRGSLVESRHSGDIALVDSTGKLLWSVGDPGRVTYARSSAKPLQALPLVESGAADYFGMSDEEIALACASHNGEPAHVERVAQFLTRIGITPDRLRCGVHPPYYGRAYEDVLRSGNDVTAVHNNCSGKHAGMLAMAKFLGADLDTYQQQDHPVQRQILTAIAELCDLSTDDVVLGIDGCGVPVFGVPLAKLAMAFAKLASPAGLTEPRATALRRIAQAMIRHPHLVAGTDRFCTTLMVAGQGSIVGKAGAEGVYCAGLLNHGVGLCVKIDDGNSRAAYPSVVEALAQSGLVDAAVIEQLLPVHRPELRNHQGTLVGQLRPVFQLSTVGAQ